MKSRTSCEDVYFRMKQWSTAPWTLMEGGGVDVYFHLFLTSALDENEWSALPPAASSFEKEPPVHFGMRLDEIQSWSGLCKEKKSCLSAWKLTPISRSSSTCYSHNRRTDWAISAVRWGGNDIMFFNMESWNFRNLPSSVSVVNYVHCEKNIAQSDMFVYFSILTAVSYGSSWLGIWNSAGRYSVNICEWEVTYEKNFQVRYRRCVFNN